MQSKHDLHCCVPPILAVLFREGRGPIQACVTLPAGTDPWSALRQPRPRERAQHPVRYDLQRLQPPPRGIYQPGHAAASATWPSRDNSPSRKDSTPRVVRHSHVDANTSTWRYDQAVDSGAANHEAFGGRAQGRAAAEIHGPQAVKAALLPRRPWRLRRRRAVTPCPPTSTAAMKTASSHTDI